MKNDITMIRAKAIEAPNINFVMKWRITDNNYFMFWYSDKQPNTVRRFLQWLLFGITWEKSNN